MTRQGRVFGGVYVLTLLTLQALLGQAQQGHFLRLKSRSIPTDDAIASSPVAGALETTGRVHLIAQTDGSPLDLDGLAARRVSVLGYIPDNGVAISASTNADLTGLGFRWIGTLDAEDRQGFPAASTVDGDAPGYYVTEFYSDVDLGDARASVFGEQIAIQENPNLLAT